MGRKPICIRTHKSSLHASEQQIGKKRGIWVLKKRYLEREIQEEFLTGFLPCKHLVLRCCREKRLEKGYFRGCRHFHFDVVVVFCTGVIERENNKMKVSVGSGIFYFSECLKLKYASREWRKLYSSIF